LVERDVCIGPAIVIEIGGDLASAFASYGQLHSGMGIAVARLQRPGISMAMVGPKL
jgi:hypothetical protein